MYYEMVEYLIGKISKIREVLNDKKYETKTDILDDILNSDLFNFKDYDDSLSEQVISYQNEYCDRNN
jgi:hypothetical protein